MTGPRSQGWLPEPLLRIHEPDELTATGGGRPCQHERLARARFDRRGWAVRGAGPEDGT